MSKRILLFCCFVFVVFQQSTAEDNSGDSKKSILSSIFVDDIVVESTLNVRPKAGARQGRGRLFPVASRPGEPITAARVDGTQILNLKRSKRQNYGRQYPQYPQNFGQGFKPFQPPKFSASNAQAQAQAFQNNGPLGGFGAASAGAGSQGFAFDENGFRANAGLSGSQSYNLPNGQTIALSYSGGYNVGPDGKPTISKGNSIAFTGPTTKKPLPVYDEYEE